MCSSLPRVKRWISPRPPGIWCPTQETRCLFNNLGQNSQTSRVRLLPGYLVNLPLSTQHQNSGGCFLTREASIESVGPGMPERGSWDIREGFRKGTIEFPRSWTRYDLQIFFKLNLIQKGHMPFWLPKASPLLLPPTWPFQTFILLLWPLIHRKEILRAPKKHTIHPTPAEE